MGYGAKIRTLRKQKKLTQAELAEKINVHETTIRRWELERNGKPNISEIEKLSEFFNVSPGYLLNDTLITPNISNAVSFKYWGEVADNACKAADIGSKQELEIIKKILEKSYSVIASAENRLKQDKTSSSVVVTNNGGNNKNNIKIN